MSDLADTDWSETAGSNSATPPDGFPEGQSASSLNNSAREIMSAIKRDWNLRGGVYTTGGTANAQTITPTVDPAAYAAGMVYRLIIGGGLTNTGATTLKVGGLATRAIVDANGDALIGGELQPTMYAELIDNGTHLRLLSEFRKRGAWTPTLTAGSGSSTLTTTGLYIRRGPLVHVTAKLVVSATTLSGATVKIEGLPYAVRNSDGAEGAVSIWYEGVDNAGAGTDIELVGYFIKNTATIGFDLPRDASTSQQMAGGAITTSTVLRVSGRYETTA